MAELPKTDYCIEIDFKKGTDSPSRVFRSMAELIDTFQVLDRHLVSSVDVRIEPVLLLEDIDRGSIKTWLTTVLRVIPDDSIYNLNWKPIVGQYLVKAKYAIINFLEGKTTISNSTEINLLGDELHSLAEQTGLRLLPDYARIRPRELLGDIQQISSNLSYLTSDDKASYITPEGTANFNLTFKLAPESIDEMFVEERLSSESELILKVKRLIFLGNPCGNSGLGTGISQQKYLIQLG